MVEINSNKTSENNCNVKNVIAVVSGKGGVGKSLVTSLLASKFQRDNFKTGVMDADITGPSIPKMFGVKGSLMSDGTYILPKEADNGTKVVSLNLMLEDESEPVIWRGPVIANTVKQFWTETNWGDLDYLFIDMPPGTGDVPLTVFQSVPITGIVIVTSPQELVSMIVKKAVNMAKKMNIPILGVVENMSYFKCPDCGKVVNIYGESHIDEIASADNLKVIEKIPFDSDIAKLSDMGEIYNYNKGLFKNISEFM